MKNLADRFLSESEKEKIIESVKKVENVTSGEIVPMVVSSSYNYPLAEVKGAAFFSIPIAIALTYLVVQQSLLMEYFPHLYYSMWMFLGIGIVLYILTYLLLRNIPSLKRMFITDAEIDEEVQEAAVTSFFRNGLYLTRDKTGVLIFISVFEHRVWVLADTGINEKVDKKVWDEIVQHIVKGIKEKRQGEAICEAITRVGEILKEHFPVRHDDKDELDNLIIGE